LSSTRRGRWCAFKRSRHSTPHPFTALGWQVKEIARAVAELRERGIAFERYEFLTQDDAGIWTTADGAKVAWFKDPDGNTLSLTQVTT
jgi:hypothetical protein